MTFEEWLEQEANHNKLSELYQTSEEIEAGLKRAWQAGHYEGYEEGYEQGQEECSSSLVTYARTFRR